MSIEVRIPKDINEYKEKILFGLSIRQLLCFGISIAVGVSSFFLLKPYLGSDITGYVVILLCIPFFALGFVKINGFPFEKYFILMFKFRFGSAKRYYSTELSITKYINKKSEGMKGNVSIKEIGREKKKGLFRKQITEYRIADRINKEEERKRIDYKKHQELQRLFKQAEEEQRNSKREDVRPEHTQEDRKRTYKRTEEEIKLTRKKHKRTR